MPNINDYVRDTGIGGNTGKVKIDDEGNITLVSTATVWDDVVGSLIGKKLFGTTGTVDYDYEENGIIFQRNGTLADVNDTVVFNLQYPHSARENGTMNLHIHWEQTDTYTSLPVQFSVAYRVQSNGSIKNSIWNDVIVETNTSVFPYTTGTLNQITPLVDVDMTGAGISATVQFKITRSDGNAVAILGTFIDAHVEVDSLGSNDEFVN